MNKFIVSGNLVRDVEHSVTPSGVSLTKFTIANNRAIGNGERATDYFNIIAWRKLADSCHTYLKKGDKVLVVGVMTTRKYDNKDGKSVTAYEVQADEVEFMPKGTSESAPQKAEQTTMKEVTDTNLPF